MSDEFPEPTARDVALVAASLGLTLSESEAEVYVPPLRAILRRFQDWLVEASVTPDPPVLGRPTGRRPTPAEDPYGAWLWRCDIHTGADGPLSGRTVAFKDHISVAGIPQSFSSSLLEGLVPDVDATVVTRVLAAGGRVVGKNVMSGFVSDRPQPRHPTDPTRSPGGSSSGSAVAVAVGDVDIAFGGDQGGSVRVPAAYCGIVGLKPTYGLVSHFGVGFGSEPSLDHVGPLAATVADVARALEAVAGADPLDPRQGPTTPARIAVGDLGGGVDGLRVGMLAEAFAEPIDAGVRAGVLAAVDALAADGAQIDWVSVPEHRAAGSAYAALQVEGAAALFRTGFFGTGAATHYPLTVVTTVNRLWQHRADLLPARTKLNHIAAEISRTRHAGAVYATAHNARPAFVGAYERALSEFDVLAMPTVRSAAPPLQPPPSDQTEAVARSLDADIARAPWTYNTLPFNYTGHPALAVPCGTVDGLPISLQLVGRSLSEPLLLRIGAALEA